MYKRLNHHPSYKMKRSLKSNYFELIHKNTYFLQYSVKGSFILKEFISFIHSIIEFKKMTLINIEITYALS